MKLDIHVVNASNKLHGTKPDIDYDGRPYTALRAVQAARTSDQHTNPGHDWRGWTWTATVKGAKQELLRVAHDGSLAGCNVAEEHLNAAGEPDPSRTPHVSLYVDGFGPHGERIPDEVGVSWDGRFSTAAESARAAAREALEADPLREWSGWEWRVVIEDGLVPLLILDGNGNGLLPEAFGDRSGRVVPNDDAERRERTLAQLRKAVAELRKVLANPEGTNDQEHNCAVAVVETVREAFGESV